MCEFLLGSLPDIQHSNFRFLPETKNIPLPETFRDALILAENATGKYNFYGLGDNKSSASLVEKESADGASTVIAPEQEERQMPEKESIGSSLPHRSETFTDVSIKNKK